MKLPVTEVLGDIATALTQHQRAILVAPPGAGKTTQVPLYLLQELEQQDPHGTSRILLLEPRRLAVKNTAEFLAQQLAESPGERIGYRMRQDSKVGSKTRLEVITEGVLLRLLQTDPSLEDIHTIIFDEFHERSLAADLGLSLSLQTNALFRDQDAVRLLVMSATLETEKLAQYLDPVPVIISEGRQYPISYHYLAATPEPRQRLQTWAQSVEQALADQAGNILVFLPGQADIQRLHQQLQHLEDKNLSIYPLYGRLTLAEQRQAISAPPTGQRKVVLATNIAETSLTIDGIGCVIDSGLHKQALFEAGSGLTRLHTRMISAASATQRAGRAGRLQAGHCYRQWSQSQQQALAQQSQAAIKSSDLSSLVLQLLACGYSHMDELDWLDAPSAGAWQQAVKLLDKLQAVIQLEQGLALTERGQRIAASGIEPRLAQVLISGIELGQSLLTYQLISQLEFPQRNANTDIAEALSQPLSKEQQRLVTQLQQRAKHLATSNKVPVQNSNWLPIAIAKAWPDRVAQKQNQQADKVNYKLANGRGVQLNWPNRSDAPDYLVAITTFAAAQQSRDQISSYVSLSLDDIEQALPHLVHDSAVCQWNKQTDRLDVYQARMLNQLLLQQGTQQQVDIEAKTKAVADYLASTDLASLNWSAPVQQWLARIRLLYQHANTDNNPWPNLSHHWLTEHVLDWLGPYLSSINSGKQLAKLDLLEILKNQLSFAQQQDMKKLAPTRLQVPSGNNHSIDYSQQPPVLAVKLQELFGMQEVPKVAYKVNLQVHLLSPAGRPLAITQDLAYFWRNAYIEVKKEMQGRYAKHPWPDDPLTALATAKTKKRLAQGR